MRTTRNASSEHERPWTLALPLPVGGDLSLDLFLSFSNMLEAAVFALDPNGMLIGQNGAAAVMLDEADGLRSKAGVLSAAALEDAHKLARAVSLAVTENASPAPATMRILAVRRCGRAALTGTVVPSAAVLGHTGGRASVFVFASDPEVSIDDGIELVCKLYGLTRTESQVSRYLVQGFSTGDIALAMELKEETIRAYLKHIYTKTQVHGQASLVQLLMSSRPAIQIESCHQEIVTDGHRGRQPTPLR